MFYGLKINDNPPRVFPLTREMLEALIDGDESVVRLPSGLTLPALDQAQEARMREHEEGLLSDQEYERKLILNKKARPYLCTCDFTPNEQGMNVRNSKYALWAGFVSHDFDHIEGDLKKFYEEHIKAHVKEWNLVAVFISPSKHGLKLISRIGKNEDIAEVQEAMAKRVGLECDKHTKDIARATYLVSRERWLYLDLEGMFTPTEEDTTMTPQAPRTGGCSSPLGAKLPTETQNGEVANQRESQTSSQGDEPKPPVRGVGGSFDYAAIVAAWWEQHGTPSVGVRHASIYQLANNLRYICENDPQMTYEAIKTHDTFGKPDQEVLDICKDVCAKRGDYAYMPRALKQVINSLSPSLSQGEGVELPSVASSLPLGGRLEGALASLPPALPQKLPFLVKTLISRAPKKLHSYLAMAIWPSLMVLPKNLKVVYSTNELRELAQLTLTMGPFSSGKSAQNAIINAILKHVKESDKANLARLKDWLDKCKSMGANKQKPPRPDDIVIQIANPDITGARFWEMQNDLRGATMYIRMNEMDQLRKLPNWSSTTRAAFDREESGQDRVGPQSVNAHVDAMRLNMNMSSTIGNARHMLRNELRNGTLSRLTLCCTATDDDNFDDDTRGFKFGQYDEQYYADISAPIANLEAATGTIDCPQARKLATKMLDECYDQAILSGNATYKDLAKRAVEQAFYRAVTLYIAQGMKWTKETETFIRWSLEYDLWCKTFFFGDLFDDIANENAITHRGRKNLLESLPEQFTRQEFHKMMPQGRTTRANEALLRVWRNRRFIVEKDGLFVKIGKR